jgi:hypothetical protein
VIDPVACCLPSLHLLIYSLFLLDLPNERPSYYPLHPSIKAHPLNQHCPNQHCPHLPSHQTSNEIDSPNNYLPTYINSHQAESFTRGLDSRTLSVPLIQLPPLLSTLPTSSSLSLTFYSYPPSLLDILYQSISIYISPDLSISTQYLYCKTSTASQHLGMKASRQREETE